MFLKLPLVCNWIWFAQVLLFAVDAGEKVMNEVTNMLLKNVRQMLDYDGVCEETLIQLPNSLCTAMRE